MQEKLDESIDAFESEGGSLAEHLILTGFAQEEQIYRDLAESYSLPYVDLDKAELPASLAKLILINVSVTEGWLPIASSNNKLIIATSYSPGRAVQARIDHIYPGVEVTYVISTPRAILRAIERICRPELLYIASQKMAVENPEASARVPLTRWQWAIPPLLVVLFGVGIWLWTLPTLVVVFALANFLFIYNILFKGIAAVRTPFLSEKRMLLRREIELERIKQGLPEDWPKPLEDSELPIYTILVPAYKEANVLEKLVRNLGRLDYPKSKMDVILLLEEDDHESIELIKQMEMPYWIRVMVVPAGAPQTKPRACNYGLALARGEFVVIFDAEDRPDPDQLKKAVQAFRQDDFERDYLGIRARPLIVVQAALNYFNADYNILTRMFSNEYSFWFDGMLPGLDDAGIPIPLGGTSNHFRVKELRIINAWDPYNVTEDADLGIRISTMGGRVGTIESTTWEEACAEVFAWIRQRTRWIKGYMVTGAVNMRHPVRWTRENGFPALLSLTCLIIGTALSFLAYPLVFLFTALTYIGVAFVGLDMPAWIYEIGSLNMILGNGIMIIASAVAAGKRYGWRIASYSVLLPIYWFLHSIAAWRASIQMYTNPHKWEKTPHGLTEDYESALVGSG
ncbi:MAG: glycosyltransferase [Microbacteriaceae bacterium]|nr:glycosyltransferase [Microbacteriaceae bacterium]